MTGLEKIIEKINADSEQNCKNVASSAEKKVAEILSDAEKAGDAAAAEIALEAQKKCESIEAMARSRAEQVSRQTVLAARVEAINYTLDALDKALVDMPLTEYFNSLTRISKANAMPGSCVVRLNAADLKRMPEDFPARLSASLKEADSSCEISGEAANIDGGLILVYGDIEINCSFAAIIEAKADELKESIAKLIFD